MRVHPVIAALRSDRAPQRKAQSAMKAALDSWRAETGSAPALADFERFGEGAALEECPALEQLFTGQGDAEALMQTLMRHFSLAIAANPLGHPPFRNSFDGFTSTIQLATSGRAQLLLQAREPGEYKARAVTYSDNLRYDAVLAGKAQARIIRIHGPEELVCFTEEPIRLAGGARLAFDCSGEMLLAKRIDKRLVTLRLLQATAKPRPVREYCRTSGKLLHRSAGAVSSSRLELMTALVGRMGRSDGAPVLAELALREGENSLRWQALRECLALDTAQGFVALVSIARNAADPLAGDAGALRAQLLENYPQLRELEMSQCPA